MQFQHDRTYFQNKTYFNVSLSFENTPDQKCRKHLPMAHTHYTLQVLYTCYYNYSLLNFIPVGKHIEDIVLKAYLCEHIRTIHSIHQAKHLILMRIIS